MNTTDTSFASAHGTLPYKLTNDYLFRAILQRNNKVLKGLICSLLHLTPNQVKSVIITNPIELGKTIDSKTYILDIRILLNNHTIINLEMQVLNRGYWPERSLSYLCRSFDSLLKGDDYSAVKPVIHISILDFTLFPEYPEFYSTYMLLNVKNNTIYSDKFRLSVVHLNQIDLATEEDKKYQIDYWAKLFKATTWEEIKMLAEKNEYINEAYKSIYEICAEMNLRDQLEAEQEYYHIQHSLETEQRQLMNNLKHANQELNDVTNKLVDTKTQLSDAETKLSDAETKLSDTQNELDVIKLENERLKAQLEALQQAGNV